MSVGNPRSFFTEKLSAMEEDEEERDQPWNFHTCKLCLYRSKSAFIMCKHVAFHRERSKTDIFLCDSNTPEMFECEFCEFKTDLKVALCEHFRVFHGGKQVNNEQESILQCFMCKNCYFKTYSVLVLTKHTDDCNVVVCNYLQQKSDSSNHILVEEDDVVDTSWFEDSSSQSSTGSLVVLQDERKRKQHFGSMKKTIGKVKIDDHNVEISLSSPVHFGIYHVTLFHGVSVNGNSTWIGYLREEKFIDHECFPAGAGQVASDSARDENSMLCAFSMCCPKGATLKGKETFINSVGKFVTVFTAPASVTKLQLEMKRHCCYFCSKFVTCIGRHLQQAHGNKPEMEAIMTLSSHDRLKELKKLRLQGDKLVSQKPSQSLQCLKCKAFIELENFRKHEKKCRGVEKETLMRRHCCCYCSKLVTCIGRHLQRSHSNESEVRRILALPSSDKVRELKKLRLQGDKAYNATVKLDKRIPVRKPILQQISESVECPNCNALIARKNMYKHKGLCFRE